MLALYNNNKKTLNLIGKTDSVESKSSNGENGN